MFVDLPKKRWQVNERNVISEQQQNIARIRNKIEQK